MDPVDPRDAGWTLLRRSLARLRAFGPVIGPTRRRDGLAGVAGAGLALLICAAMIFGAKVDLASGAFLIAPMGATAVILFALPNSPLAQPWSAVIGNGISALVVLAVHQVVHEPALAIAVSGCMALGAMFLTRALHPPGGAIALTGALNPDMLDALGLRFVLVPVVLGTVVLVAFAVLWHRLNGRVYPFRQPQDAGPHATTDKPAQQRLGVEPGELAQILTDYRQSANLGVEDLARLIAAAEQVAGGHVLGAMTCDAIMSCDLVTVPADARAGAVADLFRKNGFTCLPVVDAHGALLGVVFQLDLLRATGRAAQRRNSGFAAAMAAFRRETASGIPRAAGMMTTDLPTVRRTTPVAALLPMLADGGAEAVPVLEGKRIVGIVTRTDLLSAMARANARAVV